MDHDDSPPIILILKRTQKKLQVRLHGPSEPGSKVLPLLHQTTCSDGCLDYLPQPEQTSLRKMQIPKNEGDEIKRTVRWTQVELRRLADLGVWEAAEREFQEKGPCPNPMSADAIADVGRAKPLWLKERMGKGLEKADREDDSIPSPLPSPADPGPSAVCYPAADAPAPQPS